MEFIAGLLFELLVQIIGEVLFEFGLHSVAEPFRKPPNPWLAAVGYAIFGAVFGALSLWPFPHSMISSMTWRHVNLVVTPVAAGLCMAWLGSWRARRGHQVLRIDRFSYGSLFALSFALVRFACAN